MNRIRIVPDIYALGDVTGEKINSCHYQGGWYRTSLVKPMLNGLRNHSSRYLPSRYSSVSQKPKNNMEKDISRSILQSFIYVFSCDPASSVGAKFKLITAGPEEIVVGLHGLVWGGWNDPKDLPLLSDGSHKSYLFIQLDPAVTCANIRKEVCLTSLFFCFI